MAAGGADESVLCLDALQEHTKEELDIWKIVRVSEDFRVIALGLPVPKYKGNPLDPPLRSRFQARDVYYLPFKVCLRITSLSNTNHLPRQQNVPMMREQRLDHPTTVFITLHNNK